MRKETELFAEAMDAEKERHQAEKGDSWKTMEMTCLYGCLNSAIADISGLYYTGDKEKEMLHQVIDCANIASFIMARQERE